MPGQRQGRREHLAAGRNHSVGSPPRWARRGSRFFAAILLALFCAAGARPGATAADRTLSFVNTHTNERLTVTYKRNGVYIPEAMAAINHILRDWRRDETIRMDPRLIDLAWEVTQLTGATQPIYIICGYRAPETNALLRTRSTGVAENSQHMYGNALDFYIPGVSLTTLRNVGLQMQIGGVGFYPTSGSPFVHLDTGSVRNWPRLSRTELAQVFPDGHTLYIPADGQPLPGYAEAQAMYQARGEEVVALYGAPAEGATRLAGLFTRDQRQPAAAVASAAGGTMVAAVATGTARGDPTVILAPPSPRPNRDPIPGVAVAAAPPTAAPLAAPLPILAYAAAPDPDHDPLAMLNGQRPTATARDAVAAFPLPAARIIPSATPAPIVAVTRAVTDPLARFAAPSLEGTNLPIFDGAVTSRQAAFARLQAPDTSRSPAILAQPERVLALGFRRGPSAIRADRFSGPLIRQIALIDFHGPTTLALAR